MANEIQLKNTIVKKLENSYAIWFQQSKSFVLLEEPAYNVFQMVSAGTEQYEITKICKTKYGHLEEKIDQFVEEIIHYINHYNNSENTIEVSKQKIFVQLN